QPRGVQPALAILRQGRSAPQAGELAAGVEICPAGTGRPLLDIGHEDAQVAGNLHVIAHALAHPSGMSAPHPLLDRDHTSQLIAIRCCWSNRSNISLISIAPLRYIQVPD